MKSRKYKALLLLICTTLLPLLALNLWINKQHSAHLAKVLPLLVALLVLLGLNLLSAPYSERISPIFSHGTLMTPLSSIGIIGQGEAPFFSLLKIWAMIMTMAIVFTMVIRLNFWLSLFLLGLIPLDILCQKFLCRQLISLSYQAFPAFQELAAAQEFQLLYPTEPEGYAPAWNSVLQYSSKVARGAILVLALADFISWNFHPLFLALYVIILPLYLTNLNEIVYGNLSKRDLVNSIKYLKAIQDNRNLNTDY